MKRKLILILTLILTAAALTVLSANMTKVSAATYSGSCGEDVNWRYNNSTGVLTISGTGTMSNFSEYNAEGYWDNNAPWKAYCSSLKSVIIENGVKNIGSYAFSWCSLTSIIIPDSITIIGKGAFSFSSLTSVIVPNSVVEIGDRAFHSCSHLKEMTIPFLGNSSTGCLFGEIFGKDIYTNTVQYYNYEGKKYSSGDRYEYYIPESLKKVTVTGGSITNGSFSGCKGLTSIVVGNGVTRLGDYAFSGCTGLTSISISDSVTSIGYYTFGGCSGLSNIIIPNSVTTIGKFAFSECRGLTSITIGNSVTSIGENAFYYCTGLTSITIPDSVTSIGGRAFYYCTGVTSITIGNSVTSIGENAFYRCTGLTSIKIPNSVTSIGEEAFYLCTGLTSITIGNSLTSIGDKAFSSCTGIKEMTVPGTISMYNVFGFTYPTWVEKVTIVGNTIRNSAFSGCKGLTSITVPDSVTSIGGSAFFNTAWYNNQPEGLVYAGKVTYEYKGTCPSSVTIKDGTVGIADSAFSGCAGLTSITIPDSVTSIGNLAFEGCTGLTSITIPDSVTSIGSKVFSGCSSLTSVVIPRSVTSLKSDSLVGVNILVYRNSYAEYFCKDNSISYFYVVNKSIGDFDDDGNITDWDAILFKRFLEGHCLDWDDNNYSDLNDDRAIDNSDLLILEKYLSGKGDVTIFNDNKYPIYYLNTKNTVNDNPTQYTVNTEITLKEISVDDYVFLGWKLDGEFVKSVRKSEPGSIVLTAIWEKREFSIHYETNGGNAIEDESYVCGDKLDNMPKPHKEGVSFGGWYTDRLFENKFDSPIMPKENITLYAKWISYEIFIEYDESSGVSENKELTQETFSAVARDTDGNTFPITVEMISGEKTAGNTVTVRLSAIGLYDERVRVTLQNVKVYGMPDLNYDDTKVAINVSDELNAELFSAVSKDSFGCDLNVKVVASNVYSAGETVSITLSAEDNGGNIAIVVLNNIRVYGAPSFSFETDVLPLIDSKRIPFESRIVAAYDSFGSKLDFESEVQIDNGKKISDYAGESIEIIYTASDSYGNTITAIKMYYVYDLPILYALDEYRINFGTEISLESLDIYAIDSKENRVENIRLELVDGVLSPGNVLDYKVIATDISGNIAETAFKVYLYGMPVITFNSNKTGVSTQDSGKNPLELFEVRAVDSFNNDLEINYKFEGTFRKGQSIKLTITATDAVGNKASAETDWILVYSPIMKLDYNSNLSDSVSMYSDGREFNVSAKDCYGNDAVVKIIGADEPLEGGKTMSIKLVATDVAGNEIESDVIYNKKVYDKPIINFIGDESYEYCGSEDYESLMEMFVSYDSFGKELIPKVEVKGIDQFIGKFVISAEAEDKLGNVANKDFYFEADYVEVTYNNTRSSVNNNPKKLLTSASWTLEDLSLEGYSFDGWYMNDEQIFTISNQNKDIVLEARWSPIVYKATFMIEDKIISETDFTIEDSKIAEPDSSLIPVKDYYDPCWDYVIAPHNMVIKLKYVPTKYTITYLNVDGAVNSNPKTYTVEDEFVLFPATKTGYNESTWEINGRVVNEILLGTYGDLTISAEWGAPIEYSIVLIKGKEVFETYTYTVESNNITLPDLGNNDLYAFAGWFDDNGTKYLTIDTKNPRDYQLTAKKRYVYVSTSFHISNSGIVTGSEIISSNRVWSGTSWTYSLNVWLSASGNGNGSVYVYISYDGTSTASQSYKVYHWKKYTQTYSQTMYFSVYPKDSELTGY